MVDTLTPAERSRRMALVKGKDTKPELLVRKWLWANGYRYRLHGKGLPGRPDIVFPGRLKVIFVHGCFWHRHRCKTYKRPASNTAFWAKKIDENVRRDRRNLTKLTKSDWKYFVVWECDLRPSHREKFWARLRKFLDE